MLKASVQVVSGRISTGTSERAGGDPGPFFTRWVKWGCRCGFNLFMGWSECQALAADGVQTIKVVHKRISNVSGTLCTLWGSGRQG